MKRALYLLLLILSVDTANVFGGKPATGRESPSPTFFSTRHIFTLEGKTYATFIDEAALVASPAWDMDQPPPINFKKVVDLAREEFEKRLRVRPKWKVTTLQLCQANSPHEDKWYYAVTLQPPYGGGHDGENFVMLVDFSGKPGNVILDRDDPLMHESKANGKVPSIVR